MSSRSLGFALSSFFMNCRYCTRMFFSVLSFPGYNDWKYLETTGVTSVGCFTIPRVLETFKFRTRHIRRYMRTCKMTD